MLINKIHIENYKSLVDINLINPNPFTVFFGTNAAGKSNLFEILELSSFVVRKPIEALKFFGDFKELFSYQKSDSIKKEIKVQIQTQNGYLNYNFNKQSVSVVPNISDPSLEIRKQFSEGFSRIFLGNEKINKEIFKDNKKLNSDGSNKERVLARLLNNDEIKNEILEWLQFTIPGFENLLIKKNELNGEENILVYEENCLEPFVGNLISDGTKNSIALITALYQMDEPQFLLIEEPENGLNPKIIKEFVNVCRELVVEKKHNIWLATHSQTLVSELSTQEAVLVFKENGYTKFKQFLDLNLYDLRMDEAWLSNVLGGGIPW